MVIHPSNRIQLHMQVKKANQIEEIAPIEKRMYRLDLTVCIEN